MSGAAVFAAACAVTAARGATEARRVGIVVRATGLAAAALLVVGAGTLVAAPGSSLGPTSVALVVSALTVVGGGGAWAGTGRLAALLTAAPTAPPVTPHDGAEGTEAGSAAGTADVAEPADPAGGAASPEVSATGVSAGVGPASVGGLTAREREVLAALAEGASNAGIAAQLVVSERTVDAHLRAIFVKLGLTPGGDTNRRVRAARIWLEHAGQPR
ncbi:helix-turn-helix transcriptional regulator [Micromonospora sp. ANENR4]|nr:helix-turn-helix transcriptional regulator [Micromonospora sp. ANENR4]